MDNQSPLDEEEYRRWRDEADRVLAGARLQAKAGLHNWACFAAEQSAQLAMKGLLHGLGRGPWGPRSRCARRDGARGRHRRHLGGRGRAEAAWPSLHRGAVPRRSRLGPPGRHYGEADVAQALDDSETILRFVDQPGGSSVAEALEARRRERDRLLGLAREYVDRLSSRIPVVAAAAVGSVARGDFNVWSDVAVVVVAEGLPERYPDRSAVLLAEAQARIQPVGFTADEFEVAWEKGNALVKEAAERSVPLLGDGFLRRPRM